MSETYQSRVNDWLHHCFGSEIASSKTERSHRFIEEALEAIQAGGCTASEAHQLVDYVFNRPVGDIKQEVGGVMNTLAAFCLAHGFDMMECAETELIHCWAKSDQIRAKQAAKPKHSPLPEHVPFPTQSQIEAAAEVLALRYFLVGTPQPLSSFGPDQEKRFRETAKAALLAAALVAEPPQ